MNSRLFDSNPEEGIKQCHNLLMEADLEASVRYGDVYGLLIEYYAARENYDKVIYVNIGWDVFESVAHSR